MATLSGAVKLFESFDSISSLYTWLKERFATVGVVDDLVRTVKATNETLQNEISSVAKSLDQSLAGKMAIVETNFEQHARRLDALNKTIGRSFDVAADALSDQMENYKIDTSRQIDLLSTTLSRSLEQSLAEKVAFIGTGLGQHYRQIDALNGTWSRSLHALSDQMLSNKVDTARHMDLLNSSFGRSLDATASALTNQMHSNKADAEAALISAEQRWSANVSTITAHGETLSRSVQSLAGDLATVDTSFARQSRQIDTLNDTLGRSLQAMSDQMLSNKVDAARHIDSLNTSLGRSLSALTNQVHGNKADTEAALVSAEQRWTANMSSIAARTAAAAEADKIRTSLLAKQIEDVTSQLPHFASTTSIAQVRSSLETVQHTMDGLALRVQGNIGTFNASLQRMSVAVDLDRARVTQYLTGLTAVESRLDTFDVRMGRTVYNLTSAIESLSRQLHFDTKVSTDGIAKSLERLDTLESALKDDRSMATQSWKRFDDRTTALEVASKGLEVAAAASKEHYVEMNSRVNQLVDTLAASNRSVSTGLDDISARFATLTAQTQAQDAVHIHSASMQTIRLDNLTDRVNQNRDLLSRVQTEVGMLSANANETTAVLIRQITAGQNLSARVSILESTLPLRLDADKVNAMPAELKDLRATVDRVVSDVRAIGRGDVTFFGGMRSAFVSLVNTAIVLTAVLYFVISTLCIGRTNVIHPVSGDDVPVEGAVESTTAPQQNQEDNDIAGAVSIAEDALRAQFEVLEESHKKLSKSLQTAVIASRTKITELSHRLDRAVDIANSTRQQDNSARQQEILETKNASLAEVSDYTNPIPSYVPPLHGHARSHICSPITILLIYMPYYCSLFPG